MLSEAWLAWRPIRLTAICDLPAHHHGNPCTSPIKPCKVMQCQITRVLSAAACVACHSIPDTTGSSSHFGPPLAGIASRQPIAGQHANTPENRVRWLRCMHEGGPLNAMPEMGVGDQNAANITAYFGTLKQFAGGPIASRPTADKPAATG